VISSLAWLDSALVGKDAKLSYAFLSGVELAKRIGETFVFTAVTPGVVALLRNVVLPHAQIFAIPIALGDLAIGISLIIAAQGSIGSSPWPAHLTAETQRSLRVEKRNKF
jgi:hypothetical protein